MRVHIVLSIFIILSPMFAGCTGVEEESNQPGKLGPWTASVYLTEGWKIGDEYNWGGKLNLSEINPFFTFTIPANRTIVIEEFHSVIHLNSSDSSPEIKGLPINFNYECEDGLESVRSGFRGTFWLGGHGNCTVIVNGSYTGNVETGSVEEISWGMTYCLLPNGYFDPDNIVNTWNEWPCEESASHPEATDPEWECDHSRRCGIT